MLGLPAKDRDVEPVLVSVVIPAYNRAAVIGDALESVKAQTHRRWEVIVVDDGSTDGTVERIEAVARADRRIRLLRHERNRGAQAARNTGVRAATGDWIAFLDSDDRYLPHSLEARLEAARPEAVEVVHSECRVVRPDGSAAVYGVPPFAGRIYRDVLRRAGPVFPGLLVRRAALDRIGLLDERIVAFQEWDTTIRLARHHAFAFVPTPTFIYETRAANAISRDFVRAGRGYEQVLRKHLPAILFHAGPRAIGRHYRVAAQWYGDGGDARAARRCRAVAILWSMLDPRSLRSRLLQRRGGPLSSTRRPQSGRGAGTTSVDLP